MKPSLPISSSTSRRHNRGCPKRHFGEYELSPSLIGLSLLPTAHPSTFQRKLVRASSACYGTFTLAMGRSLGFASAPCDYSALFRLALATAYAPEVLNLATKMQLVGSLSKRHAVAVASSDRL